ncbi:hypothetical protein ABIC08_007716 [Bradyrhizobium sp. RT9b]|uniref:hypothetical protein n=1 Tax=unclassified Bradyrhizobium TaxID=2631580 RepID=UPI003392D6F1
MVKKKKKGVLDGLRRAVVAGTEAEIKKKLGRPFGDPDDVRTLRLAQRVHPHMMAVLDQRAREYGLSRSQFIERILVDYLNSHEYAQLDAIGRWVPNARWTRSMARRVDQLPHPSAKLEIGQKVEKEWREHGQYEEANEELEWQSLGIETTEQLDEAKRRYSPRKKKHKD